MSLLRRITERSFPKADASCVAGTRWENCEFRSYRFEEGDNKNASLQETEESKSWRNETSKPLTKEEKTQLRETATKKRDEEGYEKATEV